MLCIGRLEKRMKIEVFRKILKIPAIECMDCPAFFIIIC